MKTLLPSLLSLLCTAGATAAQDVINYKFNEGCGDKVTNYAAGASAAPADGTLMTTLPGGPAAAWTNGVFNTSGLIGAPAAAGPVSWVDTGWNPGNVTGSVSWACWMKVHGTQAAPSLTYVFGVPIGFGFRLFTGTSGFLFTASFQGTTTSQSITSKTNVWSLATAGWVHVACVIDATALTGTYYINGVAEAPMVISSGANFPANSFYVGRQTSTTIVSVFDLDEFVLVNRVLTPVEIAVMALSPVAADAAYGTGGCSGLKLGSTGGTPALGNAGYGLVLDSVNPQVYSLGIGRSRCMLGPVVLPFDLGAALPHLAGCNLDSSLTILFGGSKVAGPATFSLPIPGDPNMLGFTVYVQTISQDLTLNRIVVSNPFAVSLGR